MENIIDYLQLNNINEFLLNKVILKDNKNVITIEDLLRKSAAIGKDIVNRGYINKPIGVIADHFIETIVIYIGILYSGNYFVPIDRDINKEKFENILNEINIDLIYCDNIFEVQENYNYNIVQYESIDYDIDVENTLNFLKQYREQLLENSPLYIIFTSGSTGNPKGIIKSHKAMISFIKTYIDEFGFNENDIFANQQPFYFDASFKDIFTILKLKAQMIIIDSKMFMTPLKLVQYLNDEKVTILQWVSSALSIISKLNIFKREIPKYLRKVLFVGELFETSQLLIWRNYLPYVEFINIYGASELAGICMFYRVPEYFKESDIIPLGYPMKNCEIYLVDNNKIINKKDKVGEIYIKTPALANGYINSDDITINSFVENPIDELCGRFYKSGDLAKYGLNNELIFIGRKDFQIKHMGYRIELLEIEICASKEKGVNNVCCVYCNNKIILFYDGIIEKAELLKSLKQRLISYMIPNKIFKLDKIPLNKNGKIDKKLLKEFAINRL